MRLEKTLADALHQADRYQPSPDLFARVKLSIEEDRAHRRRVAVVIAVVTVLVAALVGLLMLAMVRSPSGVWMVPVWSVEVVEATALIGLLVGLGPAIRRLGEPLIDEVFHLAPETGARFSRLLDLAYYILFTGIILSDLHLDALEALNPIPQALTPGLGRLGVFLLVMGLTHTLNLIVLPAIGLIFGSSVRRASRGAAASTAPPLSARAARADRVATWLVVTTAIVVCLLFLLLVLWRFLIGVGIGAS